MYTSIFDANNLLDILKSASIIKNGGLVAVPTETVYGLAADMFSEKAVKKVYFVKKRPTNNPLIVHIASIEQFKSLVLNIDKKVSSLVEAFWPGPLTLVLEKSDLVPGFVTAGQKFVGVRFPDCDVVKTLIKFAGVPLVAPSANISGRPSPTKFEHVFDEMNHKIDAIIKGGALKKTGIESTIVSLVTNKPKILRAGSISVEEIEKVVGEVSLECDFSFKHSIPNSSVEMVAVSGSVAKFVNYIKNLRNKSSVAALCFKEDAFNLSNFLVTISIGSISDDIEQASNFYDSLRKIGNLPKNIRTVYVHLPRKSGISLAIYNRILESSSFNLVEL